MSNENTIVAGKTIKVKDESVKVIDVIDIPTTNIENLTLQTIPFDSIFPEFKSKNSFITEDIQKRFLLSKYSGLNKIYKVEQTNATHYRDFMNNIRSRDYIFNIEINNCKTTDKNCIPSMLDGYIHELNSPVAKSSTTPGVELPRSTMLGGRKTRRKPKRTKRNRKSKSRKHTR